MEKVRYYYSAPMYTTSVVVKSNHRGEFDPEKIVAYSKSSMKAVPRLTICALLDTETNLMNFGIARCNPADNFCRAVGREIALKNAIENPIFSAYAPNKNIGVWRMNICQELENNINNIVYDRN